MKDSPCYGCGDRRVEPNCHDVCARYAKWKEQMRVEKAARAVGREADAHTGDTIRRNCKRAKTRRQKGQR